MKQKQEDIFTERDVLGQEKPIIFKSGQSQAEAEKQTLKTNEFEMPSIKTRYISMLIDFLLIFIMAMGIGEIFIRIAEVPDFVRALAFLLIVVLYEPILVTLGCTLGQFLTNIRVRHHKNPQKKIWFISAVVRIVVKAMLGWLSFITISFSKNRRAIHDMASGSVVIVPKV